MSLMDFPLEVISEIFSFLDQAAIGRNLSANNQFRRMLIKHWVDRMVGFAELDITAGMGKADVVNKLNHTIYADRIFVGVLKTILKKCTIPEVLAIYKFPNYKRPHLVEEAILEHMSDKTDAYCREFLILSLRN